MTSGARSMRMPPAIRQEAFYRLLWTRLFLAAPLEGYGVVGDRKLGRDRPVAPACGAGRPRGIGGPAGAAPQAPAPLGRPAPGPAAAGPHRRLGRAPGGLPGSCGPPARVPAAAVD